MSAQPPPQQQQQQQPQKEGGGAHHSHSTTSTDLLEAVRKLDAALASLLPVHQRQSASFPATLSSPPRTPPLPPRLTHYRQIPPSLQVAYKCLDDGAHLIHATSTKHALLYNIETTTAAAASTATNSTASATIDTAHDLLRGCQLVATGATVVAQQCGASASRRTFRATRAIVLSTAALMELTTTTMSVGDEITAVDATTTAAATPSTITTTTVAQKTGAVWEACESITNPTLLSSIPRGNRAAMRRDLLSYQQECHDTMEEFQTLVDAVATAKECHIDDDDNDNDDNDNDDERYDPSEIPVASAGIALVKCSKGLVRLALQTLDAIGAQLNEPAPTSEHAGDDWEWSWTDQVRLTHLAIIHGAACEVGHGATDLGAALYPPLDVEEVTRQIQRQSDAVEVALDAVANAATNPNSDDDQGGGNGGRELEDSDDTFLARAMGSPVAELHAKLSAALLERRRQAAKALEALAS